ncbi:hypothetical protein GF371_05465 [Candidatus Woesearchaeota archaeon]|nr:hypothetical protein [Candidatus Woesearchaeota archaeon]
MKLKFAFFTAFFLLMIISTVQAAVLQGVVYDYSLNRINNVEVQLDGEKDVTENGEYMFEVSLGEYTITAKRYNEAGRLIASETDTIKIKEEKKYVLDLILFESLETEEELLEETENIDVGLEEEPGPLVGAYLLLFRIFIAVVVVFFAYWIIKKIRKKGYKKKLLETEEEQIKKREKELEAKKQEKESKTEDDADKILSFIKQEGGRTTQLDIRKRYPSYSEAKISLIIADLEEQGKIKKIKKGRGNIIIANQ